MDSAISKVADAGLSSLFQAMFDTLTPSFLQSLGFLFGGVEGEAQNLKSTLSRIQALLNDAEDRQIREESVRLWLRELKDAAYDAEYVVDEVEYHVLRSKIEGAQMQTRKRKLTDQVSDFFSTSVSNLNMGPRIKEIGERLEKIESSSNHLHLKAMRKSEMGGLGKTTLAQQAYNDERVDKHFEHFYCLKSLRTLSLSYTQNIPADLFINLRHIRTLQLSGGGITELPESIGDLLQLRYLDLSGTNIERLPKSTTRLYNLQTLILDECDELVELPSDLSNLVNLRHLRCDALGGRVSIPPRIGTLKGLQRLRYFNVGKKIGRGINELKDLIHLRGSLCISELENVVDVEEAKDAQLKNKQKIDNLELRWTCDSMESRQEGIEEEVLNALQPHTNLKELQIEGYCGVRFPTWLGDSNFSNLTVVRLRKCKCRLLSPFGRLPSLKYLSLGDFSKITSLGNGLQHLTSLEDLTIVDCPELTSLYDVDLPATLDDGLGNSNYSNPTCLPKGLHTLILDHCPKIPSLPEELLTTLQSLEIEKCPLLEEKYLVLAEGGNGYRCKISDIPHIIFPSYYKKINNEEKYISLSVFTQRK